jgi:hypothetical protein
MAGSRTARCQRRILVNEVSEPADVAGFESADRRMESSVHTLRAVALAQHLIENDSDACGKVQ